LQRRRKGEIKYISISNYYNGKVINFEKYARDLLMRELFLLLLNFPTLMQSIYRGQYIFLKASILEESQEFGGSTFFKNSRSFSPKKIDFKRNQRL
jgi:hypothetical protein